MNIHLKKQVRNCSFESNSPQNFCCDKALLSQDNRVLKDLEILVYFPEFLRFLTLDIWQKQQRLDGEIWETCEIYCDNWSTHVPCILRYGFTYLLSQNDRAVAMESWMPSKQEASNSRISRLTDDRGTVLSSLTIFVKTGLFPKFQETNGISQSSVLNIVSLSHANLRSLESKLSKETAPTRLR